MKKYKQPSTVGRFGEFGGMYVSETLMPLLLNLDKCYKKIQKDKKFKKELNDLFKNYVGRPSSLHYAKNLSKFNNRGINVSETYIPPNSPNLPTVLGCLYVFINYKLMK